MNEMLQSPESPPSAAPTSRTDQACCKIRAVYGIDFREAIREHNEWKKTFGVAISKQQALDVESISNYTCCNLGRWLYDDARRAYRHLSDYLACLDAHKAFHLAAANVAQAINEKPGYEAKRMFAVGTGYSAASIALGFAITRLMRAVNQRELRG